MLYLKFQLSISSCSGEKVDFSGLVILATAAIFYCRPGWFRHSEALQPRHAA